MDFIIHPRSTAISHFQRPLIRTDSAEIRRATGISLGTAPLHPVYLRCHLHCRFTWCRSSLLCRRQPTLYLHCLAVDQRSAALRLVECIEKVEGWMKSNRLKLNSYKTQFMWLGSRQQLAKIDTKTITIGETLHRILDFRQESRRDIRQ